MAAFSEEQAAAIPIQPVAVDTLEAALSALPEAQRNWAKALGFEAKGGSTALLAGENGTLVRVLAGTGKEVGIDACWSLAGLARSLPPQVYRLDDDTIDADAFALAWGLGGYSFQRYRTQDRKPVPTLVHALGDDTVAMLEAVTVTRDLINTPASDLGPTALEAACRKLAEHHGAHITSVTGDDLLAQNYPMVHAVGRASRDAPRVIDMVWGKEDAPKITLVGKGVTFDTGGLNIKPGAAMGLMKKDMGGAANVLGLAHMIMARQLPVRLRVIIGAVENAISGNAFRPGDVLQTRNGMTVEIGNTDAEGRLVLGDCLTLADEEAPDVLVDMATLTGAARVALGPELAPLFTDDNAFADALSLAGNAVHDPLWRMPLWAPYQKMLASKVADVNHISTGPFGGSITAALFLSRFVKNAKTWAHFDIFGWVPSDRPWAKTGGEAFAIRALFTVLKDRYPPVT
ncbi:MAG: leucyl aminopeptidase family protein [Pseudomonadota bacterium]